MQSLDDQYQCEAANPAPTHSSENEGRPQSNTGKSRHSSSCLSAYMQRSCVDSFNSVRWPDTLVLSDSIPDDLPEIPTFLYYPRPPPRLPTHILAYTLNTILRRYNRMSKLIDNYQRWHGRGIFSFWTSEDLALAASGDPELTKAFEKRPSVPPYILNTRFDTVLISAPVLSHLIERYHNDLGFDYFAFYSNDPRDIIELSNLNAMTDLAYRY
ncbi:hypothetical protein ANO14919_000130 [Xylariales sp. No.14919]|nr:hypothetical protein ANO14919_000130 [Xylariales sp. No.14919]